MDRNEATQQRTVNLAQTQRRAYRIHEAAEATGLSVGMIRKEIEAKRLKKTHVGRAVLILAEDLDAWLRGESKKR
jgi:excisionase family DNA binding protein